MVIKVRCRPILLKNSAVFVCIRREIDLTIPAAGVVRRDSGLVSGAKLTGPTFFRLQGKRASALDHAR
jgi:hypothetical protein